MDRGTFLVLLRRCCTAASWSVAASLLLVCSATSSLLFEMLDLKKSTMGGSQKNTSERLTKGEKNIPVFVLCCKDMHPRWKSVFN